MKQYRMLFALVVWMLVVSLACIGGNVSPTAAPTVPPTPAPTKEPSQLNPPSNPSGNAPHPPSANNPPPSNGASADLVTFVDENDLLAFDLPGNWTYEQYTEDDLYIDQFTSPDGTAEIDSLVFYNNGSAVNTGAAALYLLNNYYSNTGKEGDIKVTKDSIEKDGSERLDWLSKGGDYSGSSWFEARGSDRSTFLMFTTYWVDGVDDATFQAVNDAITSYHLP